MIDNKISIFKDSRFGEIRTTVDEQGEALFCLKDVCDALGLTNSRKVAKTMSTPYVTSSYVWVETGTKADGTPAMRQTSMTFIGEPNLYRCIFQSRKKEAEEFQNWIYEEVLPSIRKNGGYLIATAADDENTIVERALNLAQKAIQRLKEQNTQLTERNDYLSSIFQAKDLYRATDIAQKFGMSTIKFNKKLNEFGVQYKQNGQWVLYADKANLGLADIKTYVIGDENEPHLRKSLQWTPRGLEYIFNLFQTNGINPTSMAV